MVLELLHGQIKEQIVPRRGRGLVLWGFLGFSSSVPPQIWIPKAGRDLGMSSGLQDSRVFFVLFVSHGEKGQDRGWSCRRRLCGVFCCLWVPDLPPEQSSAPLAGEHGQGLIPAPRAWTLPWGRTFPSAGNPL